MGKGKYTGDISKLVLLIKKIVNEGWPKPNFKERPMFRSGLLVMVIMMKRRRRGEVLKHLKHIKTNSLECLCVCVCVFVSYSVCV